MATVDRIAMNPAVMMGKPVIAGTRITVELLLRRLAEGATPAQLLEMYPQLIIDDIHAAKRYSADTI